MTLYDDLGVAPDADDAAIRAAYRRRAKEEHPDAVGGDEEAQRAAAARFGALTYAYDVLTDPGRRARYDRDGETGKPADPDAEARAVLAQAFETFVAHALTEEKATDDIVRAAQDYLGKHAREFGARAAAAERGGKRARRLLARVKGAVLEGLLKQKIEAFDRERAEWTRRSLVTQRALALCADYSHEPEPVAAPPRFVYSHSGSSYRGSGGGGVFVRMCPACETHFAGRGDCPRCAP